MPKTLKTFYGFIWRYKKPYIVFTFFLIISAVLENISPYFYKILVDNLAGMDYWFLLKIVFVLVGVKIVANLLNALSEYLGDKVVIPAARDARLKIFRKIQDLDFAFHVNKNTGSLISAFKRGDGAFFSLFLDLNGDVLRILVGLFVTLWLFIQVAFEISLIMLFVFIVNAFLSWLLVKANVQKRAEHNKAEDKVSAVITDNLINYETVKFFAQEQKEERRLRREFKDWWRTIWVYANSFRLMNIIIGTLSGLGVLAILWVAVERLISGQITTGDFVMVSSLITGFYYSFFHLLYRLREIAKKQVDIQRYFSLLDNEISVKDPQKPVNIKNIKGNITFDDVDFSYPDGKQNALVDFSVSIKAGESVAFVGRSGAGKTTITKVLLRFYDLDKGKIMIDNIDISKLAKSHLRSFIGIVPQEPILFNNTIGFNIAYGNDKATKKDIIRATKMANLDDFIQILPEKYETHVGERGIKLSGGQKQRLAIARMLLIDPKIIIFDEATSNLDSESEGLIQDALWRIAKDKTVLIIAHRFSTVRKADRIIVLDDGRMVQNGPHKKLIKEKGIYRHLWNLQLQGKSPDDSELLV